MSEPIPLAPRLKKWHVTAIVHVWPKNDLIEHTFFDGCQCGAEVTEGKMKDGAPCYEIIHNALDGRE